MKNMLKFNLVQVVILYLSHLFLKIQIVILSHATQPISFVGAVRGQLYDLAVIALVIGVTDLVFLLFSLINKKLDIVGAIVGYFWIVFFLFGNIAFALYFETYMMIWPASHLHYLWDPTFAVSSVSMLANIPYILFFILIPVGAGIAVHYWVRKKTLAFKWYHAHGMLARICVIVLAFIIAGAFYQIAWNIGEGSFLKSRTFNRTAFNEHYIGVFSEYAKMKRRERELKPIGSIDLKQLQIVRKLVDEDNQSDKGYISEKYPLLRTPPMRDAEVFFKKDGLVGKIGHAPEPSKESIQIRDAIRKANNGKDVKPNVVIILLESFRAHDNGMFGSTDGLSPNFDRLCKEGVLFTDFWPGAQGTMHAQEATLMSVITTKEPFTIFEFPSPVCTLTIYEICKRLGYSTLWIHNSNSVFNNQKGFYLAHMVDLVLDDRFYKADTPKGSWGVSEKELVKFAINCFNRIPQPFCSTILTVNLHSPYILPSDGISQRKKTFDKTYEALADLYFYTDEALGQFFELAKKEPWYKNTIFVVLADEGGRFRKGGPGPLMRGYDMAKTLHHIPLLFIAPGLKPGVMNNLGYQADIVPTILSMLDVRVTSSFVGEDLFAPGGNDRMIIINDRQNPDWVLSKNFAMAFFKNESQHPLYRRVRGAAGDVDVSTKESDIAKAMSDRYTIWSEQYPKLVQYDLYYDKEMYHAFVSNLQPRTKELLEMIK